MSTEPPSLPPTLQTAKPTPPAHARLVSPGRGSPRCRGRRSCCPSRSALSASSVWMNSASFGLLSGTSTMSMLSHAAARRGAVDEQSPVAHVRHAGRRVRAAGQVARSPPDPGCPGSLTSKTCSPSKPPVPGGPPDGPDGTGSPSQVLGGRGGIDVVRVPRANEDRAPDHDVALAGRMRAVAVVDQLPRATRVVDVDDPEARPRALIRAVAPERQVGVELPEVVRRATRRSEKPSWRMLRDVAKFAPPSSGGC